MKAAFNHGRQHLWLLLFLIALGLGLRLIQLAAKPLWTDEFSTIVFSLGNRFLTVPLDQVITADQLLQPLRPQSRTGVDQVVQSLLSESNHPPLYFILSHFWLKLFPTNQLGTVSAWAARSLSVLFGVASIPASYWLGRLAFRSRIVGQVAAGLMAVSPFAVYLAQEARHYTLPILWIIASLCCLIVATRTIRDRIALPYWVCWVWILINGLGIASHYFFTFTLIAEAVVIACLGLVQSWREGGIWHPSVHWQRIWLVAAGTAGTGIVWFPVLLNIQDGELTRWIYRGERSGFAWLEPVGQAVAGWISMIYLLPIQSPSETIAVLSGAGLLMLTLWTLPKVFWGLNVQCVDRDTRLSVWVLGCFVISAILLFFSITYLFEAELTGAFRYNFVYFPGTVALIAAGLAAGWNVVREIAQTRADQVSIALLKLLRVSRRKTILLIGLLSLVGGLTVVFNLGYQKVHRPDVVAQDILRHSSQSTLIAIPHRTHGQTGRLMGVALAVEQAGSQATSAGKTLPIDLRFLLAHDTPRSTSTVAETLDKTLSEVTTPIDLWLINFHEVEPGLVDRVLKKQRCAAKTEPESVDGYRYRMYRCRGRVKTSKLK
ncbi:glycosyltransferase [Leptolyngbya sp. FACHB-711]|uniref:glycosyltransferase family 39 protein n=1 Tax=unclassified Leptolyngbya TaxID=2650499 RepID=UPI001688BFF5|nr:glycosyltransferase [Leptolyngbya sp. FACHB-711]MBD1848734.1 glycosyltransferase [Cyanobacteria bacterium FACHB-502]MBD2024143.1 glycosyltransferase [Leptolyngbya sp. FACHB-711]